MKRGPGAGCSIPLREQEAWTLEGARKTSGGCRIKALRGGRAFFLCVGLLAWILAGLFSDPAFAADQSPMTVDEAAKLGEEFGVMVGEVDEEIQKELKLQRPQGVAVFEVIGNSRADYAGIKVRSVIKEIDKTEIRTMLDFGRAIKKAMTECNFTVGTYEPADPGDPVGWGVNFHFVGCKRD
jgi:S1-C subfamily serine protease